jgi:S-adenosylmethionine:tRNA ribosyltransferase-isomerase
MSIIDKYDYEFPEDLIAQKPAHPRDSAKLLIYNRKNEAVSFDVFRNIGKYLPSKTVLVLNETKVLPARFEVQKSTGAKIKLLYLHGAKNKFTALSPKKLKLGETLSLGKEKITVSKVLEEGYEFTAPKNFNILKVLEKYGSAPLPPYIKHSPLTNAEIKKEYQTVFAKKNGSVAAPTASLHFTKKLLAELKRSGIKEEKVTLHVGLGTFATLTEENIKTGKLHREYFEVSKAVAERLRKEKKEGAFILPVGTTALRTLESVFPRVGKLSGETDIFIKEGDKLKFIDGLITNFHVPKSSLIMLVSALIGRKKTLELYGLAIKNKFRLFSFGDAMLIL